MFGLSRGLDAVTPDDPAIPPPGELARLIALMQAAQDAMQRGEFRRARALEAEVNAWFAAQQERIDQRVNEDDARDAD